MDTSALYQVPIVASPTGSSCVRAMKRLSYACLSCTFALVGAMIGSVSGALKGQTTETGFFRGAAVGAVAGAVLSFDILDSCLQGDRLSMAGLFYSLINGKIFDEWVSPAMLKAYQWQITNQDASDEDAPDIFKTDSCNGLSPILIEKLPFFQIKTASDKTTRENSCAICLQEFETGQSARRLPPCRHFFHKICIDKWLQSHGSCPICRQDLHDFGFQSNGTKSSKFCSPSYLTECSETNPDRRV